MTDTTSTTNRIKWLIPVIWLVLLILGPGFYWINQPSVIQQNETSAIQSLKDIASAIALSRGKAIGSQKRLYDEQGHPILQYADSLKDLGPDLIDAQLASGEKDGYLFELVGGIYTYKVRAYPKMPGKTGKSYFFMDESAVIKISDTEHPEPAN